MRFKGGWSRGANKLGQLGSAPDNDAHPAPQAVATVAGVTGVSAGTNSACAWAAGGAAAWCWGSDQHGQLGDGAANSTAAGAVWVANPAGAGFAWAQLAAYYQSACGLDVAGAAYCWGNPAYTGAYYAALPAAVDAPTAVDPAAPAPKVWASLSAGCIAQTVFGVANDTTLYGWGRISRNRLGNGYVVNTTGSPSDKSDLQVFHPIRTGIQFTPP